MSVNSPRPIPVPASFWYRSWRTLWTWRPECVFCGRGFKNEAAWRDHYLDTHVAAIIHGARDE